MAGHCPLLCGACTALRAAGQALGLRHPLPATTPSRCPAFPYTPRRKEILHGTEIFLNVSKYSEMAAEETKDFTAKT